jgi:hypothetical protein
VPEGDSSGLKEQFLLQRVRLGQGAKATSFLKQTCDWWRCSNQSVYNYDQVLKKRSDRYVFLFRKLTSYSNSFFGRILGQTIANLNLKVLEKLLKENKKF